MWMNVKAEDLFSQIILNLPKIPSNLKVAVKIRNGMDESQRLSCEECIQKKSIPIRDCTGDYSCLVEKNANMHLVVHAQGNEIFNFKISAMSAVYHSYLLQYSVCDVKPAE